MWWLIPIIGLLLGAYFGQYLNIEIPALMIKYLSIGIMAALDSVFGGVKALFERKYDSVLMLSGFFTNALLAAALAYIGDMLSIDLYYAAVFAFGVRLFSNLSLIRVYIIENQRIKKQQRRELREARRREREAGDHADGQNQDSLLGQDGVQDDPGFTQDDEYANDSQYIGDDGFTGYKAGNVWEAVQADIGHHDA